jgi:hypothetical protein
MYEIELTLDFQKLVRESINAAANGTKARGKSISPGTWGYPKYGAARSKKTALFVNMLIIMEGKETDSRDCNSYNAMK